MLVAGDRIFGNLRRQKAQRRVEHRHVDELPEAGVAALEESARTANALVMPLIVSQRAKPARVGPLSAWPVIDMMPDIACSLPSKAAVRVGPVWPNPDIAQ